MVAYCTSHSPGLTTIYLRYRNVVLEKNDRSIPKIHTLLKRKFEIILYRRRLKAWASEQEHELVYKSAISKLILLTILQELL